VTKETPPVSLFDRFIFRLQQESESLPNELFHLSQKTQEEIDRASQMFFPNCKPFLWSWTLIQKTSLPGFSIENDQKSVTETQCTLCSYICSYIQKKCVALVYRPTKFDTITLQSASPAPFFPFTPFSILL
jgi:hypothetical protein